MQSLKALVEHGQSIWLDYIRRGMTRSGELAARAALDGIRGVTSNPAIFQKAIAGSDDYQEELASLVREPGLDAMALYEALAITDIQEACDALRRVYDATGGADGFVSLEVAPALALDTAGTVAEAHRLWSAVARPNLMIKVPGTSAGIAAVERLIADGLNVNVTLIFAQAAYQAIAQAYLSGLEQRLAGGHDIANIASVASFFVSRIDSKVDAQIERRLALNPPAERRRNLESLRGRIAIANAKLAYRLYQELLASPRWHALSAQGARPQRLLWASTGTKNKNYPDTLYVDQLIGPDTVNTVPPLTLAAFGDHGRVANTLTATVEQAQADIAMLEREGISMVTMTDELLAEGLTLFSDAMTDLLATVATLQREARGPRLNRMRLDLPAALEQAVEAAAGSWTNQQGSQRIWAKDASVWTGGNEASWLGWLDVMARQRPRLGEHRAFAQTAREEGFTHVCLLGMGGSSLGPDVLARTFGDRNPAGAHLTILDSTVPAQVERTFASLPLANTLFVVASKSGTTLEPTVFCEYALARVERELGRAAGRQFVAITDPGSQLEAFAHTHGFARVFPGEAEIGGRFSAFSDFGLVPAALLGLDVEEFVADAELLVEACREPQPKDNPGAHLGLVLGAAANAGIDKLTLFTAPAIASFGGWVEQLVAESTGKLGKGIVPIAGEWPADPETYTHDRLFLFLRVRATPERAHDRLADALADAGHPVVRIELDDIDSLAQEFFRFEFATAVAGAVMKLNPFDQPDVEAAKIATRALTEAWETTQRLPTTDPVVRDDQLTVFGEALPGAHDLVGLLAAHFRRIQAGDYFAVLAYVDMNASHERILQRIRERVHASLHCATTLGFGPRFLHSTGQAHKGGANTGVFLEITADVARDIEIPGRSYGFAVVCAAQALGDFAVLVERKRRAIRVHLPADVDAGLLALEHATSLALDQVTQ